MITENNYHDHNLILITLMKGSFEFFKAETVEHISLSLIKLILKLNPVKSQRMQETLHTIHTDQHTKSYCQVEWKHEKYLLYQR